LENREHIARIVQALEIAEHAGKGYWKSISQDILFEKFQ
jgi:hypothetical protein